MSRISLKEVVALIDDRTQAVSVIRLGDGEAGLLESHQKSEAMWPLTNAAWRYRYLMDMEWKAIAKWLVTSIPSATVVGTPDPADKTCRDFKDIMKPDGVTQQNTCSNNLNRTLFEHHRDVLRRWFKTRRVGIFYHDTIMARRRYADILGVPPGDFTAQRQMFPHVFPFRSVIEPAMNWQQENGINLALVSGGPAGKVLCVKLAQNGIDALDVGQAIDR